MKPRIYSLDGRAVIKALMDRDTGVPYEVDAARFWRDVEDIAPWLALLICVYAALWRMAG